MSMFYVFKDFIQPFLMITFVPNSPFLYPLKTYFWGGVEKGCMENKRVNEKSV